MITYHPKGIMYDYHCEYCEGTVRPKKVEQGAVKHKKGFVILEDISIGIYDLCGNRYYGADIIHAVHEIASGMRTPDRAETIPVAHLA